VGAPPGFDLERRTLYVPPPQGKRRPWGLDGPELGLVAAHLKGRPDKPVTWAEVMSQEKALAALAAPGFGGRRFPDEVELHVDKQGRRFVAEVFVDPGSCRDHWVGIARRTPIGADGKGAVAEASFWVAGTTAAYERALDAWAREDRAESLRLLAPTATWSTPMFGTVRARAQQVARTVPPAPAPTPTPTPTTTKTAKAKTPERPTTKPPRAAIDRFEPVTLGPKAHVELRDEPHLEGHVVGAVDGLPAGATPPAPSYRRVVARVRAADGYRRVGTGTWDFVIVPSTGAIGFVNRLPQK
jgi:hypothetical protein